MRQDLIPKQALSKFYTQSFRCCCTRPFFVLSTIVSVPSAYTMPSVVNDNWHSNGTWARSVPPWSGPTANGSNNGDSSHISARTTAQLHSNDGAQPARRSFRGSVLSAPVRRPGIPLLSTAVVSTITAIFLFLLVVLAGLYTALYNSPRIADFGVDELHCNWILSSIKALNHFPLPYPIDREVHGRVLGKMGRGHMLRHLEDTHSDARSNLSATVEEMIGFTAKGAQLYSRLPIEDTFVRLDRDIDTLLYRLERTDYQLGALGDIYGLVGEVYHTLHKSALEELEDGQLTTDEEFWIRAQPVLLTWIGYSNMTKLYLDPLWEKARGNDEALLGKWSKWFGLPESAMWNPAFA